MAQNRDARKYTSTHMPEQRLPSAEKVVRRFHSMLWLWDTDVPQADSTAPKSPGTNNEAQFRGEKGRRRYLRKELGIIMDEMHQAVKAQYSDFLKLFHNALTGETKFSPFQGFPVHVKLLLNLATFPDELKCDFMMELHFWLYKSGFLPVCYANNVGLKIENAGSQIVNNMRRHQPLPDKV